MQDTPPNALTTKKDGALHIKWQWLVLMLLAVVLLVWLDNTPAGLLGKADAVGYAVCHRIDLRSFHLGDRQMPLCARCSGMYLGVISGLIYLKQISPRRGGMPSRRVLFGLAGLVILFAIDGLNSYLQLFPNVTGLYEPHNVLRLLTGTGIGIAVASVIYPAFNQTAWRYWDPRPAVPGFRQLAALIIIGLFVDILLLTENSLILYPLAIISAGSVLVLLSLVYGMVWMMVLRLENRLERISHLLLPVAGGLLLGIIQIALIDLGRYLLTGTWAGFHF
jgi:uncharacterized membrane protein